MICITICENSIDRIRQMTMKGWLNAFVFQTQYYFLTNFRMKGKRSPQGIKQHSHESSEVGDCSCEMLDTSLSDVGESDCSCSECLQANLEAFNELKQMQEDQEREEQATKQRGVSTRPMSNKQTRQVSRNDDTGNKSTVKVGDFKSVDKMRHIRPKTAKFQQENVDQQAQENGESDFPKFSRECINDYMKITRNRAREYLNKRKGLQRSQLQKRNQLKSLIKENLQALKYTARNLVASKLSQSKNSGNVHHYEWNHTPYHCRSKVECRKLKKYSPNLEEKKEEIEAIKERIKRYKEENKEKPYECPDQCPRHHMRTSKKKMIQIQKFIMKNAKAYQQEQKKKKLEKLQAEKVKEAKLRAIDLKCKQKVTKSKKYDPTDQRTSFHNSIDHFSTFSELRINNHQRLQQKAKRKKIKQALKDGKQLQEAIYENLQDQLIDDHPPIHSKINIQSRYVQGQREEEEWCEKIVKDARIRPPKDIKKDDREVRKAKERKKIEEEERERENTKKSVKHLSTKDLKKEEEKRREIQAEIQRKKQEILNQYQKRNTTKTDPKNRQLREEYQSQLKQETQPRTKQPPTQKPNPQSQPYRQTYKHQPTKAQSHMRSIGDPLLQEYHYHQTSKRAQQLQSNPSNRELFTSNPKQLMQKKILKV